MEPGVRLESTAHIRWSPSHRCYLVGLLAAHHGICDPPVFILPFCFFLKRRPFLSWKVSPTACVFWMLSCPALSRVLVLPSVLVPLLSRISVIVLQTCSALSHLTLLSQNTLLIFMFLASDCSFLFAISTFFLKNHLHQLYFHVLTSHLQSGCSSLVFSPQLSPQLCWSVLPSGSIFCFASCAHLRLMFLLPLRPLPVSAFACCSVCPGISQLDSVPSLSFVCRPLSPSIVLISDIIHMLPKFISIVKTFLLNTILIYSAAHLICTLGFLTGTLNLRKKKSCLTRILPSTSESCPLTFPHFSKWFHYTVAQGRSQRSFLIPPSSLSPTCICCITKALLF